MFFLRRLFLAAVIVSSASASGAVITAKSTKRKMVKIDEGIDSGFIKGAKVCVFKNNRRLACGTVRRAKTGFAYVRIKSKKRLKRVKKGMEVRLHGNAVAEAATSRKGKGSDHRTNLSVGWLVTAMSPATYNKLTYKATETGASQDTLWTADGAASLALFGVVVGGEFGVGESMAISLGLRYRIFSDFLAQSDYSEDKTRYADVTQTASSIGFYSDFTFLDIPLGETFFWRTKSGLDMDMSTVSFKATHKNDAGDNEFEIASATSKLSVLSLRLGTSFDWMILDPLGFTFAVNALVPLASFGQSFSGSVDDPNQSVLPSGDGIKDLEESLDHKQGSVGIDVVAIGAFFAF